MSRVNMHENDDQLVARYVSGLRFDLKGELIMQHLTSLEEAYQMALKSEEKLKWSSCRKPESLKNVTDKAEKVVAPTCKSPKPQGGGNKDQGKAISSSNKCFRCGEPGHRSYECPKMKAELNLMEEETKPVYDEELGVFKEELCNPNFDAESLLIRRVMVTNRGGMVTKVEDGDVFNKEGCCKNAVAANVMTLIIECSNLPNCDEYPQHIGMEEKNKLFGPKI
ncbi:hypothetical protein Vadar_027701 [Vaccinium darrowii]|uniref:Uncharacterized protein n=1 Tax=Vaccinium darrowii TaxID=229202 RepID=A0ACB7Z7J6_9ERIC|nr:hypothetical protein Vadar_027701 [Vaccinium darrowii]